MEKLVKQFLDSAVAYAAGEEAPPRDLIGEVSELPLPRILNPANARDALWQILSYPERARALAILNAVDLIIEIVPSWTAYMAVQDIRLAAVEEVHKERWADGLSEIAFNKICSFHDAPVDGRLNGWALTSLATLLVHEAETIAGYLSSLRMDFSALEATDGEVERIMAILTEFSVVQAALAKGEDKSFKVLPATIVSVLATMFADEKYTTEQTTAAIQAADRWLTHK
jgi:hypothetical protein